METEKIKIESSIAKKRLATLWFVISLFLFTMLMVQTLNGKFSTNAKEVWAWLFSSILPTLMLILSIFLYDVKAKENVPPLHTMDRFYFRLVYGISIFYLLVICLVLLSEPIINRDSMVLIQESAIYTGPFQGLLTAAMAMFFFKKD